MPLCFPVAHRLKSSVSACKANRKRLTVILRRTSALTVASWVVGILPPVDPEALTWKCICREFFQSVSSIMIVSGTSEGFEMFKTPCYMTAGKLKYVISPSLSTGASENTMACQTDGEICLNVGSTRVFGSLETQPIPQQMVAIRRTPYRYIPDTLWGIPVLPCCNPDCKSYLMSPDMRNA